MPNTDWKKYPVLFNLYIAQAVPMSFFTTVVPVIMRQENYSLEAIGMLQLVKLPWVLKFLWAPIVDNNTSSLGHFKRWIYVSEFFYAGIILAIGFFSLQVNFSLIVVLMLLAVIASATQDIATDAFAIHILKKKERGYGNSMQSAGGFAGHLIGSGVLLVVYYYLGWFFLLFFLAVFVLLALIPLAFYRKACDKPVVHGVRVNLADITGFFRVPGMYKWIIILFFYYSGLMGIMAMLKPYLVDLNYNAKDIGLMAGIFGTGIALVASIFAGFIVKKIGYAKSLRYFLGLSLLAGIYFYVMSISGEPTTVAVYAGIFLLWLAYGASMVAVYTAAMDMVRPGREGTDFTLQIVITHLSGLVLGVMSGKFADSFGYDGLFLTQALLSIVAFGLLMLLKPDLLRKHVENEVSENVEPKAKC
ncbi:MAG: MFS transporter [Bacteroidales bacterium]|nr:MFS transporter [Bacteroidales bacterium]